jgi:integrase
MANITKIGEGKYKVRVSKQSRGRREFFNFTFRGPLKDAREFARKQETLLDSGELVKTRSTFKEYADTWLATVKKTLAPLTYEGYAGHIRRQGVSLEKIPLDQVRLVDVQKIYNALSPANAHAVHRTFSALFNHAVKKGVIRSNPCRHADLPKKPRPNITVIKPDHIPDFVRACREIKNGLILELALETGMRPEEYLALRWSDLHGSEVTVERIVQYFHPAPKTGPTYYFDEPKTSKSRRRVPISEDLRKQLIKHRLKQNEHRMAMKGTWFDHDLIFPNIIGRPERIANVRDRVFRAVLDKAFPPTYKEDNRVIDIATGHKKPGPAKKIIEKPNPIAQGLTLYSLRHTCATMLLLSGVNPKVVADRLGHASVTITLDTYSHVLPHIQADATDTISKIMRG